MGFYRHHRTKNKFDKLDKFKKFSGGGAMGQGPTGDGYLLEDSNDFLLTEDGNGNYYILE